MCNDLDFDWFILGQTTCASQHGYRHFIMAASTKIHPYLMGAAAGSLRPVEHRVPEVLDLACGLDTSEAVHTWILAVWGLLCRFPLDLEQTTMSKVFVSSMILNNSTS